MNAVMKTSNKIFIGLENEDWTTVCVSLRDREKDKTLLEEIRRQIYKHELSNAASALGYFGGRRSTASKRKASAGNGKLGGRPKKVNN